jgi:hypothetical protein
VDPLLKELVANWKRVRPYVDVEAQWWTPGDPVLFRCPHGCQLDDTAWSRMLTADAHLRIVFCRAHGFARVYAISGPEAADRNWTPDQPNNAGESAV